MTDQEIIEKITKVLERLNEFFDSVDVIPESYRKLKPEDAKDEFFYRNLWLNDKNHRFKPNQNMFSFNADEIEQYKIPSYVVGCSGRADLFAKYATEAGLKDEDIRIVPCVKLSDVGKEHMNGHQIVAVKMSNGWQLLNPARGVNSFNRAKIDAKCEKNEIIDATNRGSKDYQIADILTTKEHAEIDSREKLESIYLRARTAKTAALRKSKEQLDYANKNRELTQNNYNKSNAIQLGNQIIQVLQPLINDNMDILKNWSETDYEKKKQFVKEALEVLLNRFPSETIKPKILFKDDIGNIDVQKYFGGFSAAFFAKETSPWAADAVKKLIGNDEPLFIFMDDLKDRPLGQIAHEFTHYLQATNQSTISPEVLKQSIEYYPHINGKQQTHNENIQEAEAIDIGDYVRQQTRQMLEMSAQTNIITQNER